MCTIAASTAKTEGVPTAFLIVCLLLLTLAAHGSGVFNGFVPYDDNVYVYDNPHVRAGLTLDGVIWAFHALQGGNWNPLVWLSHMFVVSVAGPNPLGQHLFNLLLHCGNVVLFFLLLQAATGARIRSLLAAALFAVHPVHVESVAWIAERKDVLSMLFGMLALHGYVRYARTCSRSWHTAVFFLLLLGLMAKAMLVTLPLLFLLMDFWPLNRLGRDSVGALPLAVKKLVLEKLSYLMLCVCIGVVTIYAQKHGGALAPLQEFSLLQRLANVVTSYIAYCGKLLWPVDLAVLYPLRAEIPLWKSGLCALLLCLISAVAIRYARRVPYLLFGWLWYLVALLPVIGIFQVGIQSMADRYAYLPFLGLYVLVAWAVGDLVRLYAISRRAKILVVISACALLVLLAAVSQRQTSYWWDGESLFRHALDVTEKNYQARRSLAQIYNAAGKHEKALAELRIALGIRADAYGHWILAHQLMSMGREQESMAECKVALQRYPDAANLHKLLGFLQYRKGLLQQAEASFARAMELAPNDGEAAKNLRIVKKELAGRASSAQGVDQ